MDAVHHDVKDVNGHKNNNLSAMDSADTEDHTDGEDYSESNALLVPKRGGMSRKSDKTRRKVQWNDRNGNKLVEIMEFEPSDVSDSDDDDDDDKDYCMCIIM
ncbi:hypothetical protein like AT2G33390 [Hibiscus trionum]|uniref:Uncharacterized protein n=1 Tax=Hibiscus trionum TaxID=183268 RepID=A0A9W7LI03_HIBTR|nr:hypothetical protein like AT2G33390 [Hibiscus trionum]